MRDTMYGSPKVDVVYVQFSDTIDFGLCLRSRPDDFLLFCSAYLDSYGEVSLSWKTKGGKEKRQSNERYLGLPVSSSQDHLHAYLKEGTSPRFESEVRYPPHKPARGRLRWALFITSSSVHNVLVGAAYFVCR